MSVLESVALRRRRRHILTAGGGLVATVLVALVLVQSAGVAPDLEVAARSSGDRDEDGTATRTPTTTAADGATGTPSDSSPGAPGEGTPQPGPEPTGPGTGGQPGGGAEPDPPATATTTPAPLGSPRGWYGAEGCIATSENSSFEGGPYPSECTYVATQPGGYHANAFDDGPWEIRIQRGQELIVYRSGENDVCSYLPVIEPGDRVTATTLVDAASPDHPADVSVGAAVSCSGRPPGDSPEDDEDERDASEGGGDGYGDNDYGYEDYRNSYEHYWSGDEAS